MTSKKHPDPAADQQARTDAVADAQPPADTVDTLRQQLADSSEALATVQHEAAGLRAEVQALTEANRSTVDLVNTLNEDKNALLLQVSERDETIKSLQADKDALAEQVQAHQPASHDEERLHNLWCEAGGQLGQFEAVKRFVAKL